MGSATSESRARELLDALGRTPFEFQSALAARCMKAIDAGERLLVVAPTGSGKTLVSQLAVALFADANTERYPRVLVVCPSRALLVQQVADAGWLRERGISPLHTLTPDLPLPVASLTLSSWGIVYTTPVTLARRIESLGVPDCLRKFDFVIFDEIDTYLTLDEQIEKRDTWPAVQRCIDAELPILGFTGTNLDEQQEAAWIGRGFERVEADVPPGWLPFTKLQFVGIEDEGIRTADSEIRDELRVAYRLLEDEVGAVSWSDLKRFAAAGVPPALRILELCYQRLELFESLGSNQGKLREIERLAKGKSPTLILSRFRHSARTLATHLEEAGLRAEQADGGMQRMQIERITRSFRVAAPTEQLSLIITRELGGRGLDFPSAGGALLVSPRNNYQAVAQELARIRSRQEEVKQATILYYSQTEEEAKARRLGEHLRRERFQEAALFEVIDLPGRFALEPFESINLRHEESLDYRTLMRLGSRASSLRD